MIALCLDQLHHTAQYISMLDNLTHAAQAKPNTRSEDQDQELQFSTLVTTPIHAASMALYLLACGIRTINRLRDQEQTIGDLC